MCLLWEEAKAHNRPYNTDKPPWFLKPAFEFGIGLWPMQ